MYTNLNIFESNNLKEFTFFQRGYYLLVYGHGLKAFSIIAVQCCTLGRLGRPLASALGRRKSLLSGGERGLSRARFVNNHALMILRTLVSEKKVEWSLPSCHCSCCTYVKISWTRPCFLLPSNRQKTVLDEGQYISHNMGYCGIEQLCTLQAFVSNKICPVSQTLHGCTLIA